MKEHATATGGGATLQVNHPVRSLRGIDEHCGSDPYTRCKEYQVAIGARYRTIGGTRDRQIDECVPERGTGLAVGIERVNAVVLRCNKHHVVHASGDLHIRHEKRLAVDERINRAGKDLAECRSVHVRWSQLRLEGVRASSLDVVLVSDHSC